MDLEISTVFSNSQKILYETGGIGDSATLRDLSKITLNKLQLTYGTAIDSRVILRDMFGIENTVKNDPSGRKIIQYERLVRLFADDLVECLNHFGFKADKTKKRLLPSKNIENLDLVHSGGNIVYTNYPWTVVYKAASAVQEAKNSMFGVHDAGVWLQDWADDYPEEFESWVELKAIKREIAEVLDQEARSKFDGIASKIVEDIESSLKSRHEKYSDMQPYGYGTYP